MGTELIAGLATALSLLASGASAYFSKQKSHPAQKKKELCVLLTELYQTIIEITDTGYLIGESLKELHGYKSTQEDTKTVKILYNRLKRQDNLLQAAKEYFYRLSVIFDIYLPVLQNLSILIDSKSSRVRTLRKDLIFLEQMRLANIKIESTSPSPFGIRSSLSARYVSISEDPHHSFSRIRKKAEPLREFTMKHCEPEFLL